MSSALTSTYSGQRLTLAAADRAPLGVFERLLMGAIILEIPIQFDFSLFWEERWGDLGAIGGLNFSITTACLGILYSLWFVQMAASATFSNRRRIFIGLPLTAYLAIAALSFCVAFDKPLAIFGLFMLVQAYLLYTYVANRVTSRTDVVVVMTFLMISLAIQGAILIGTRIAGHNFEIGHLAFYIYPDLRPGGTLVTPNVAASYLELLIAPGLALLVAPVVRPIKLLALGAIIISGIGLFLTLSRGGWVATGLSFTLFSLIAWRRGTISARLPLTIAAALLLVCAFKYDAIFNRVVSNDQGAVTTRFPLLEMGLEMIGAHPFLGVGVNNFAITGMQYTMRSEFREEWFHTIHNKYLLEWAELGVFGFVAFVVFLVTTLRTGWKAWKCQDQLLAPIVLGLTVAIGGQMVHMMVDIFAARTQVLSLWLCAGLIVAIYRMQENE